MPASPSHLMISGLDDADLYRMSADSRKEKYAHVRETSEADELVEDFDIIYIDSSKVYRITSNDVVAEDVKRERINWLADKAKLNPGKLFIVVILEDEKEWEGLLEKKISKELPNVVFHNSQFKGEDRKGFLADIVDTWRNLPKE